MAGMGTLSPVQRKTYLGKPDLSAIPALLALQGKSLKGAVEGVGDIGRISRTSDLDKLIQGMDLSKATPEDIAKLQGAETLTPEGIARLESLGKTAGTLQEQEFREGTAETLFGRQKELQTMKDTASMERLTKKLTAEKTAGQAGIDALTGLGDRKQEIDIARQVIASPNSTPEAIQEAKSFLTDTEAQVAQTIGKIKAPSDVKKALFEKTTGGIEKLTGKKAKATDYFDSPTEIFTGDVSKSYKNQSVQTRKNMMELVEAGVEFGPGQIMKDEDGNPMRDKKGNFLRDKTLTRNGRPISPVEIQRMVDYMRKQKGL